MSIRNSGEIIREARLKAGLTQEELSDGICTPASLCYIENGKKGVCPSTFQALMAKTGNHCEAYPIFRCRNDFNAFISLKNIRLYIDNWCIQNAYSEFLGLQAIVYGNNRLYYQEAVYLYALIAYKAYPFDYQYLAELTNIILSINHPRFNISTLKRNSINDVEIETLLLLANINLRANMTDEAERICLFLLNNAIKENPDDHYAAHFTVLWNYTYSKLMFCHDNLKKAKEHIDTARSLSLKYNLSSFRLEIYLEKLLIDSLCENKPAISEIDCLIATATHLGCGFLNEYTAKLKKANIPFSYEQPSESFPQDFIRFSFDDDWESMSDGVFDIYEEGVLTIGTLIGELRKEQHISSTNLCKGLCSVSKLSKIEHREQEPSIYLAEALLNRLGYSERIFVFYGNKKESHYSRLKNELITLHRMGETGRPMIKKIAEDNLNDEEPAIRQLCTLFLNVCTSSTKEQLDTLTNALKLTIPDFEISKITSFRLTWAEITILNNIIIKHIVLGEIEKAYEISKKLVEYSDNTITNIGFYDITLSASFSLYLRCFYRLSKYNNIIALTNGIRNSFYGKSLNNSGNLYFYYSQALGETGKTADMIKYAKISVGYFLLFDNKVAALNLKKTIKEDFGVEI